MLRVYKYSIVADDCFDLELPENAQILTVQIQFDEPYLWVLVNPDLPTKDVNLD